jgi:NAD(P)-dependent dehydrogenase (short-subunit alcohol dehydrogenase family)
MEFANWLAGQVAVVTGGSRGIGAEIVRRLAAEGADVGFTYHTGQDGAQQVATQVRALGRRVLTVQADLGEPAAAGAVVEAVVGEFGRLDILVNNAGITHWGALAQTRLEDFDRLVAWRRGSTDVRNDDYVDDAWPATRAQARHPKAAVCSSPRAMFQATHLLSKPDRIAERSRMWRGFPASANWSLSGTLTPLVMRNAIR